jgi:glucan phosphoethanolaminetransferase (alkaline phosphatase superfamily)
MAPYVSDADIVKRFKGKDETLVKALDKIDFTKRNFIVLHQRNSHSPYEDSTPKKFYKYPFKDKSFHTYMLHSYYNSILYTDHIISKVVDKIKKYPNSVMFMAPDHAEMMGLPEEKGRYGHAFLDKEVAKIPIFIYANHIASKLRDKYKNQKCYNHYILGKLIANTLGYNIKNSNENGKYYIQGTSIDGSNGFISYDIKECSDLNKRE